MDIRASASAALARAAHPDAAVPLKLSVVESLTHSLAAGTASEQLGAASALQTALQGAASADPGVLKANAALTGILTAKTSAQELRTAAASALGYAGNRSAVPVLIGSLTDSSASVSIAARDALARIGSDAADPLAALLGKGDVAALYASQALAQIGEAALPALAKSAGNASNPTAQRWSAVALGGIGIAKSTELLQTLAKDADRQVASAAKEQLTRLGQVSE